MNVYIIGSLEQKNDIEALACYFMNRGDMVRLVHKVSPYIPFEMIVDRRFGSIRWADLVVALKKPNDEFDQGTTYELAYAKAIGKNYRYAISPNSGTYSIVTGLTYYAHPSHIKKDYTLVRHLSILYLVDKKNRIVFEQPKELPETIY